MNINEMKVGELLQLAKLFQNGETQLPDLNGEEVKIVILQRGWVMVGRYHRNGSECKLTDAYNVRKWGTTKGLGEIAMNGPTSDTVIDKIPDTTFHALTEIASMVCTESKWKKYL